MRRWLACAMFAMLAACVQAPTQVPAPARDPAAKMASLPKVTQGSATGWGGMAPLGDGRYLIVHDNKANEPGTRLSTFDPMTSRPQALSQPVALIDWRHPQGISNDLESVCALEGRPGEVLAAESGYYKGQYGRIFHLKIAGQTAEILRTHALPRDLVDEKPANYEGLACQRQADGRTLLILGERGGGAPRPQGSLRIGWLDADLRAVRWDAAIVPVRAAGTWSAQYQVRDIADLALEPDGTLWSVAAIDPGDQGPFRSMIWRVGTVDGSQAQPMRLSPPVVGWTLEGLKVEAIATPDPRLQGVRLLMATDDEAYGAAWRTLGAPETLQP